VLICQQLQDAYNRQKTNAQTQDDVSEHENNDQPIKTTQSPNVTSTRRTTRSSKLADSVDADGSVYGTPTKNSDDSNNSPEEDVSIPPAAKSKNVKNAFTINSPKPKIIIDSRSSCHTSLATASISPSVLLLLKIQEACSLECLFSTCSSLLKMEPYVANLTCNNLF
jgi:DNA mismatch repair ATPase MutL